MMPPAEPILRKDATRGCGANSVVEVFGPVITYTYELKTNPLGVFEIIRGG
jgi:hypothetical protein